MKKPIADNLPLEGRIKEQEYVHKVYDEISSHFSNTRYKPWPVVENFINSLEIGSIGADAGCGNGKYMGLRKGEIYITGSDITQGLVDIATSKGHDCMVSDCLHLPYKSNSLDFAISIAVIHHMSTPERRQEAIKELVRVVKPGGKILIFVWALEQAGKRQFDPNQQDVLVPWVTLKSQQQPKQKQKQKTIAPNGGSTDTTELPACDADKEPIPIDNNNSSGSEPNVYYRYYHLFKSGELLDIITSSNLANVIDSGYDKDNWYAIIQPL
ncbi:tRNA (carboxymethyluridine(34)-5-O)-methyltransferase [Smittium culicis]|uniref:tRNA (Carboxymethyluridine(34)-5-O)-methyltransferase n=1 Tax=Smittium culicis TaxID=133412 RepID=A0A1R1XT79_9FUNG|nr:tRNA (carboxymethyluridine(34)-5-O)-methyltransferase [Smittium culicis]